MGEVAAPPRPASPLPASPPLLPSCPDTRKLSGPNARMSDAWVLRLLPSLLLGLLTGLQQVSDREVKLQNCRGPPVGVRGRCWSRVTTSHC